MYLDVVLAHELNKRNFIGILPPFLPILAFEVVAISITLSDRHISDACIELCIELSVLSCSFHTRHSSHAYPNVESVTALVLASGMTECNYNLHFLCVFLVTQALKTGRNRRTPSKIPGDTASFQTFLDPRLNDMNAVCAPTTVFAGLIRPRLDLVLKSVES